MNRSAVRLSCLAACLLWGIMAPPPSPAAGRRVPPPGLDPKPGARIPSDIICTDEGGRRWTLGDLFDRPVILSLVYDQCTHICPQVQVALGRLVESLGLVPGRDYRIVTFSFDSEDGTAASAEARKNYTLPLGKGLPPDAWKFVTAPSPEIDRLTGALGFSFQKTMHGFIHPIILVIVSPGGAVSRYVFPSRYAYGAAYPVVFSPTEFRRDIGQAALGRVAGPPPGPLLFCYEAEPPGQVSYEGLTKVFGIATLVFLAALFAYLSLARRRAGG